MNKLLYQPLYNSIDNNVIYSKFINYVCDEQAATFGELFKKSEQSPYVISNNKANSCYINLIVDTYHEQFKKMVIKKKYSHELTYDYLCNMLNIVNTESDLGLSILESEVFF